MKKCCRSINLIAGLPPIASSSRAFFRPQSELVVSKMYFPRSLGVVSLIVSSVQAAVSSTGFTVSLTDIDYFLPPKPIAKISSCEEIKASFEDALFVPFTVVKAQSDGLNVASLTASYAHDDVWQEGFMEGVSQTSSSYNRR
jgi:hypothetical protein